MKLVVLFGSYAKGNYTTASDINLLIVYEGEKREGAFAITEKTITISRLEPHVYTENEYEQLKGTIDRMVERGLVLFPEEIG